MPAGTCFVNWANDVHPQIVWSGVGLSGNGVGAMGEAGFLALTHAKSVLVNGLPGGLLSTLTADACEKSASKAADWLEGRLLNGRLATLRTRPLAVRWPSKALQRLTRGSCRRPCGGLLLGH